jgi:hypothetical protein
MIAEIFLGLSDPVHRTQEIFPRFSTPVVVAMLLVGNAAFATRRKTKRRIVSLSISLIARIMFLHDLECVARAVRCRNLTSGFGSHKWESIPSRLTRLEAICYFRINSLSLALFSLFII